MMYRILFGAMLCFQAFCSAAQDATTTRTDRSPFGHTHWSSAADSADFMAFHLAMIMGEETLETTTGVYRAMWHISEHGGMVALSRGDSSLWRIDGSLVNGVFMHLPFRMADGRRGFMVMHETPCGLICRDTMYYVED